MGLTQLHLMTIYSAAIVLVLSLTFASGDDIVLQKRSGNDFDLGESPEADRPNKRPFCNVFTGCVGKRSGDSLKTLYELNSEPAVEELGRRILTEAKLWEAEMERQRDHGENLISRNLPLALAMSNFRRKRAVTAFDQKSGAGIYEKSKR